MKEQATLENFDKWLGLEVQELVKEAYRRSMRLRVRQGMARKQAANKPFQTPVRDIA